MELALLRMLLPMIGLALRRSKAAPIAGETMTKPPAVSDGID